MFAGTANSLASRYLPDHGWLSHNLDNENLVQEFMWTSPSDRKHALAVSRWSSDTLFVVWQVFLVSRSSHGRESRLLKFLINCAAKAERSTRRSVPPKSSQNADGSSCLLLKQDSLSYYKHWCVKNFCILIYQSKSICFASLKKRVWWDCLQSCYLVLFAAVVIGLTLLIRFRRYRR